MLLASAAYTVTRTESVPVKLSVDGQPGRYAWPAVTCTAPFTELCAMAEKVMVSVPIDAPVVRYVVYELFTGMLTLDGVVLDALK